MEKKVKSESRRYIRSALPPQNREIKNSIRPQSEQLLILKKVRYLDGGDDNLSDRAGPTSPESIVADGGLSEYFDAGANDEASERTDVPDLVGSTPLKPILMEEVAMSKNAGPTWALIHYKKDGFLAMANAGRIFPDLHYSNKDYISVSFHEFKRHAKCASKKIVSNKKLSVGRLTKKHVSLHKLLFTSDLLPDGTELGYYVQRELRKTGTKKGSAIVCSCCGRLMSPTQFQAHSGEAQRRKPYNYIRAGVSVHELTVRLSETRELSNAENDDLYNICADGGDLLCCDLCLRAFHLACLDLSSTPDGKWHCPSCLKMHQREKYVQLNGNARAAGRIPGVDPIEERLKQLIPIVKTPEIDVGGCVLCRKSDCNTTGFGPSTILLCEQCEKEHHVGCLKSYNKGHFKEFPEAEWLCSSDCNVIYNTLHDLLLQGAQPVPDIALDIVNSKRKTQDLMINSNLELKWRLLSGNTEGDEKDILLAKALSIFHGYFQALFSCIERLLTLLKVKHLLLHAAEEVESILKTKFGFTSITRSEELDHF